jgi:glucans biosynthesis protein
MDVEATLFPRVDLTGVGLAPGTSMFFFGPNRRNEFDDYRPEVHDSDGLLIANGRGEILWRPLANPTTLQTSAFIDSAPRGFGLIQRNTEFESYQDLEAGYERRPSLWMEPIGDWGKGAVVLVEIPTVSEIHDNIVAYWAPRQPIPAGVEYGFAYRLYWGGEPELAASAARIKATRSGRASISGPSPVRLFVIDYEATDPQLVAEAIAPEATVSASTGKIDKVVVLRVPGNNGWRLTFQLDPDEADSVELRASLTFEDGRQAETWVYRWTA